MATTCLSKAQEKKKGGNSETALQKKFTPRLSSVDWKRVKERSGKSVYIWIDKMSPLEKQSRSDLSFFPIWKKAQGSHKNLHLIQHKPTWAEKITRVFPGKEAKELKHVNNVLQQLSSFSKQQTFVFAWLCRSLPPSELHWVNFFLFPNFCMWSLRGY